MRNETLKNYQLKANWDKYHNIIKTFKLLIKTRGAALGMTVSFFILSILVIGIIE